jgi:hypothetical protein
MTEGKTMFEIIDNENGRKWIYFNKTGRCFVKYYEFFKSCGWRSSFPAEEIAQEEYAESFLYSIRTARA